MDFINQKIQLERELIMNNLLTKYRINFQNLIPVKNKKKENPKAVTKLSLSISFFSYSFHS